MNMVARKHFQLIALCFIINACHKSSETILPQYKSISESVYASGIVKSKNQYNVFSKTAGIVSTVFVTEGDSVTIGSPILAIESKQVSLSARNQGLNAANADYTANLNKLHDAELAASVAQKKFASDSLLFIRQKNLWQSNVGSKVDLEQRELAFENARTMLANALTKLSDLKKQLKLNSDQSKNNYAISRSMEEDLIVKSDVNGRVYKLNLEKGEAALPLVPVAVIGAADEFELELNIDENDIVNVRTGQKVFIRMDSYKTQVFEGQIVSVEPLMNERTRTFTAHAVFQTKPGVLYPNLSVEANVLINAKQKALTIPRNYLLNDSTVMLADGSIKTVKTGLMDYNLVEITAGIGADDKLMLPKP